MCAQLTRDLSAIAKFLFTLSSLFTRLQNFQQQIAYVGQVPRHSAQLSQRNHATRRRSTWYQIMFIHIWSHQKLAKCYITINLQM